MDMNEKVELELCSDCCKSEYLKLYVKINARNKATCSICREKKITLEITSDPELKSFTRFLIRYYYSEAEYNRKWGGEEFIDLFSKNNYLFNFKRYSSDDNFLEVFDVFLNNLVDPFDHHHQIELYYGHDEHGRGLFNDPHIDSKSVIWLKFKKDLLEKNYFLLEENAIKTLKVPLEELQYKIEAGSNFYRSRIGHVNEEISINFENFTQTIKVPFKNKELGQPPVSLASAGRANRQGISFLYLASNKDTSISEVRPVPGNYVSVGKFKNKIDINLVDLRFIDLSKYYKSSEKLNLFELFRDLAIDLSYPVTPSEKNKYLVTQFLSDIIRRLNYDGLVFKSSLNVGDNFVIFKPEQFDFVDNSSSLIKITKMKFSYEDVEYHVSGIESNYKEI